MRAEHSELLHVLGYLYLQHGQPGRALALLLLAARLAPDDPDVMHALAYAFLENGDAPQALQVLSRLERVNGEPPAESPLNLLLSRVLLALGRTTEARSRFARFVDARQATAGQRES